ncbi:type VI secretion system Vgr family protein [Burkholderia contaminans]|uniref:type VI secretion system Vgr family protein n=1 Tax=Burkholderia contaminans TaxID=488447 RepID=UPI00158CCE9E|nr:type VI secretion system Vgr family protein [Burkholderia contaminans]
MNTTDLAQAIRGSLIQQDRLMKSDIPALPGNALVPRRAIIDGELGRDFSITIDMLSAAASLELKILIAQPMTLWVRQANASYQPLNGYVHTARRLGSDGALTSYQLIVASWMHFLKFRHDMRYWQDQPADQIIADVFAMHPQARGRFEFALSRPLPTRSYCRQSETDWHFVHRLMEQEGLFGFWRHAADGTSHTLVVTDDIHTVDAMLPETVEFSRFGSSSEVDAFTQWSGSRTLQSTQYTTRTFDYKSPPTAFSPKGTTLPTRRDQGDLPVQAEVYEYTGAYTYGAQARGEQLSSVRLEEWESRAKRFHGIGGVRGIDAGRRFTLDHHPMHDADSVEQRQFAAIKVRRYIENNLPGSVRDGDFPHSLQRRIDDARAERTQNVSSSASHEDGSAGFYRVEVEAQRVSLPFRSPFEHDKPLMHLETAIVVGPKGEEVYTDELNRVKVRFVWDRSNAGDERASCWLRVAQSDSGSGYSSVHLPRVGEEVIVGYVGGDCDRPVVLHRVYNGATRPQWHSNGILSGFRSKEYAGSGYNEMSLDDATGQTRAKLFSSNANSMLHLGYLIEQSGNSRGGYLGSGFDLRTDAYGAMRAGQGLYLSTYPKTVASQPLDVDDARQQLSGSAELLDTMSGVSEQHRAESLKDGYDVLKAFADATRKADTPQSSGGRTAGGGTGSANAFSLPLMLFGSPAGIALSAQQDVHLCAAHQTNVVSGGSVHVAAGQSLIAGVIEKISLFAQNAGMKLFAGKGKVEIRAHTDDIELTAQKAVKVMSATQTVDVAAKQEILLTSGGAYIRIKDGNIELHAPGKIDVKGAQHNFSGPTSQAYPLPQLPNGVYKECLLGAHHGCDMFTGA